MDKSPLRIIVALLAIIFLYCLPAFTFAQPITGKVISVADGDTITILVSARNSVKVRLAAVDCPESGQAYGKQAKKFTSRMVYGKQVTIKPVTKDRYGRTVAMVYQNGANLSKEIIANGYGGFFENTVNGLSVAIGYGWNRMLVIVVLAYGGIRMLYHRGNGESCKEAAINLPPGFTLPHGHNIFLTQVDITEM